VRGGEAFDLLQALNTGHAGSLCTLHANSARQAVTRFADCVLQSGIELPHRAIMANIGSAVDLLVLIGRTKGQRAVSEIVAMRGFDNERNECIPRRSEPLRSACSTRLLRRANTSRLCRTDKVDSVLLINIIV